MTFSQQLTPGDLKLAFVRLRGLYGLKGAWALRDENSDEAKAFVAEWYRILKRVRPDELKLAVDRWMDGDHDEWPKPGKLSSLIYESYGKVEYIPNYEPQIETGWFAYPSNPKDVQGPRYRQHTLDYAHSRGMLPIEQVECPIEGCSCFAVEVWFGPEHLGMSSKFANAKALGERRPRGWRWAHYATEHQMSPCNRVSPEEA